MIYLLDTDMISNLMKNRPSTNLVARLARVPPEEQATTSVTLAELVYGAHRIPSRTEMLLARLESVLLPNLAVIPFESGAAWHYGTVRAELERKGTPIGEADLRIGAIALHLGSIVVTGNVRHFDRIPGLRVENWL